MKTDKELELIASRCLMDIVLYSYHWCHSDNPYEPNNFLSVIDKEAIKYIMEALKKVNENN